MMHPDPILVSLNLQTKPVLALNGLLPVGHMDSGSVGTRKAYEQWRGGGGGELGEIRVKLSCKRKT
jgi:hypothetical protein